jgi:uncharacterized protein (TIGR04255 family)
MRNIDIFRLWQETDLSTTYPEVTEHEELAPFKEVFGLPASSAFTRSVPLFEIGDGKVLRYNFRNPDLREQFQLQRDRIAFFWQRGECAEDYPRFPNVLEKFERGVATLDEFSKRQGWGQLRPNGISVCYTNRISKGEGWNSADDLENVLSFWRKPTLSNAAETVEIENTGILLKSIVKSESKPIARMYVTLDSAAAPSDNPETLEIAFTVRGPSPSKELSDVRAFLEMGRRQIVTTFVSITTTKMHAYWGKQ